MYCESAVGVGVPSKNAVGFGDGGPRMHVLCVRGVGVRGKAGILYP